MVGILVSFWDGSGTFAVSFREGFHVGKYSSPMEHRSQRVISSLELLEYMDVSKNRAGPQNGW